MWAALLGSPEQEKQREQRDERQGEEERTAAVMDLGVDHAGIDIDAQVSDTEDAQAVAEQSERQDGEHDKTALPGGAKKEMRRHKARDKQDQGGVNATAFGRDFQTKSGQLKEDVFPEDGGAGEQEKRMCRDGGSLLQEGFDPVPQEDREGSHEEQEEKRKADGAKGVGLQEQAAGRDEEEEEDKGMPRQIILDWRCVAEAHVAAGGGKDDGAKEKGKSGGPKREPRRGGQLLAPQPDQEKADEWDQGNVRVQLVAGGEPHEFEQGFREADHQSRRYRQKGPAQIETTQTVLGALRGNLLDGDRLRGVHGERQN